MNKFSILTNFFNYILDRANRFDFYHNAKNTFLFILARLKLILM